MSRFRSLAITTALLLALPAVTAAMPGKGKGKGKAEAAQGGGPPSGPKGKVTLCHLPPGNPDNFKTLTVGAGALESHLAHGDIEGECDEGNRIRVRHRSRRLSEIERERESALERARRERDEALERARREAEREGRAVEDAVRDRIRDLFGVAEREVLRKYDEGREVILGGGEDARALKEAVDKASDI